MDRGQRGDQITGVEVVFEWTEDKEVNRYQVRR